jgi:integrase
MLERLTARECQTAKANGKTLLLADGGGLYLRVGTTGSRSWVFRYRTGKRQHDLGLGPFPDVPLAAAREAASAQRRLRREGKDPILERRAQRDATALQRAKAVSFAECLDMYLAAHEPGWKGTRTGKQWRVSLTRYALPLLGKLPVASIDIGLVLRVLEPIWNEKTETANRVRRRIEAVLGFATARGWRQGDNPARWENHLATMLSAPRAVAPVQHFAAMAYSDLPVFMAELQAEANTASRALAFLILTCARTDEVRLATWAEIDFPNRLWTVPAERMKGKKESRREHRVPLSDAAVALIGEPGEADAPIFPSGRDPHRPMYKGVLDDTLKGTGRTETVHGLRATFRTWAAELGVDDTLAEMALAHAVGTQVERSYQRSDLFAKRRALAQQWARFCVTSDVTRVVPIRA